ncbi:MAG TPA: OmpA family protein [Polyangiaceae bacterium]|nr:OmpA family protein [Polyangiaceae bacterium]
MRSSQTTARPMVVVFCLAASAGAAALGTACGSDPKPEPKTPTLASSSAPKTADRSPEAALPPPNTPTASSINIDDAILKACGIEKPKAHFAFDSANVQGQDTTTLEAVAKCFTTGPLKGRTLKLVGHADPRGETEYNFVLGNSRTDAVGGFLRSKGMDKAKIASTSRGELDATGTDEAGWTRDRRVDLLLSQ